MKVQESGSGSLLGNPKQIVEREREEEREKETERVTYTLKTISSHTRTNRKNDCYTW